MPFRRHAGLEFRRCELFISANEMIRRYQPPLEPLMPLRQADAESYAALRQFSAFERQAIEFSSPPLPLSPEFSDSWLLAADDC